MDQSPSERPQLFGPDGSPSSAGLATGSEVQSPGGGLPAAGGNPAANTSPYHTTQGSGSRAEVSTEDPQAIDLNRAQTPGSMAAGNTGVSMAADTNNVVGSDGYAANHDKDEQDILVRQEIISNL